MDKTLYGIIKPKMECLVECASGKYPTYAGTKLNDDLYVGVMQVEKDEGKGRSWALIFTESDLRNTFNIRVKDTVDINSRYVVNKSKGKAAAVETFTELTIAKLEEMSRKD